MTYIKQFYLPPLTWSNQSILKEISPEYSLEGLMLKLKLQDFGHLMQRTDSLEKTLMLGMIEGRRRRGRQRIRWLDCITNLMDLSLSKLEACCSQGSLACCSPWGCRVGHDWTTELNHWFETSIFGFKATPICPVFSFKMFSYFLKTVILILNFRNFLDILA